jgi:hypothetical protein
MLAETITGIICFIIIGISIVFGPSPCDKFLEELWQKWIEQGIIDEKGNKL